MSASEPRRIELRLKELSQLFNLMDPSPFRDRDLDASAEAFIVEWARELPKRVPLELIVHVATLPATDRLDGLEEAVHRYFENRGVMERRALHRMVRLGWFSLVMGLIFLAGCVIAGELIARAHWEGAWVNTLKSTLDIIGWVALWRPVENFLYDRWPLRQNIRLYDRLARMSVTVILPVSV